MTGWKPLLPIFPMLFSLAGASVQSGELALNRDEYRVHLQGQDYLVEYQSDEGGEMGIEWEGQVTVSVAQHRVFEASALRLELLGFCQNDKRLAVAYRYGYMVADVMPTVFAYVTPSGAWSTVESIDMDWQYGPGSSIESQSLVMDWDRQELESFRQGGGKGPTPGLPSCELSGLVAFDGMVTGWESYITDAKGEARTIELRAEDGLPYVHTVHRLDVDSNELERRMAALVQGLEPEQYAWFKSTNSQFFNVYVERGLYNNISHAIWQSRGDWYLFYTAGQSSKGVTSMEALGLDEQGDLSFELCVRNCDWWGEYQYFQFDWDR